MVALLTPDHVMMEDLVNGKQGNWRTLPHLQDQAESKTRHLMKLVEKAENQVRWNIFESAHH